MKTLLLVLVTLAAGCATGAADGEDETNARGIPAEAGGGTGTVWVVASGAGGAVHVSGSGGAAVVPSGFGGAIAVSGAPVVSGTGGAIAVSGSGGAQVVPSGAGGAPAPYGAACPAYAVGSTFPGCASQVCTSINGAPECGCKYSDECSTGLCDAGVCVPMQHIQDAAGTVNCRTVTDCPEVAFAPSLTRKLMCENSVCIIHPGTGY